MSCPSQPKLNTQLAVALGRFVDKLSVVNVVATVPVIVDEAVRVVSTRAVPVVVMTTGPTVEVEITLPSDVIVVLKTVTAVIIAVVCIGTLVTVSV